MGVICAICSFLLLTWLPFVLFMWLHNRERDKILKCRICFLYSLGREQKFDIFINLNLHLQKYLLDELMTILKESYFLWKIELSPSRFLLGHDTWHILWTHYYIIGFPAASDWPEKYSSEFFSERALSLVSYYQGIWVVLLISRTLPFFPLANKDWDYFFLFWCVVSEVACS